MTMKRRLLFPIFIVGLIVFSIMTVCTDVAFADDNGKTMQVTLHGNGGTFEGYFEGYDGYSKVDHIAITFTKRNDGTVDFETYTPRLAGKVHTGWSRNKNAAGPEYKDSFSREHQDPTDIEGDFDNFALPFDGSIKDLYATWSDLYTITLDANGGNFGIKYDYWGNPSTKIETVRKEFWPVNGFSYGKYTDTPVLDGMYLIGWSADKDTLVPEYSKHFSGLEFGADTPGVLYAIWSTSPDGPSPSDETNPTDPTEAPDSTEPTKTVDPAKSEAVVTVKKKVGQLPAVSKLTLSDESKVAEAYQAYKALSQEEKSGLPSKTCSKIEKAQKQMKILKAEAADKNSIKNREEKILASKSDKDLGKSTFAPLKLKAASTTQSAITLNWSKVDGAEGYVIYGNLSGKTSKMKRLTATRKNKYTVKAIGNKSLKKGKYYKFVVLAYTTAGGYKECKAASQIIHACTSGGSATNVKRIKLEETKKTLKKGKTWTISAYTVKKDSKKTLKKILGLRFESSNKSVATVSSKGLVTAKKSGKATIYVIAQNGVSASVTVTVKAK